jgi:hypothetical protein
MLVHKDAEDDVLDSDSSSGEEITRIPIKRQKVDEIEDLIDEDDYGSYGDSEDEKEEGKKD